MLLGVQFKKPKQHLLFESRQLKLQKKVWNVFKVNNKDNSASSLTSSWCLYCFEQISHLFVVFL